MNLVVSQPGCVEYREALDLQRKSWEQVRANPGEAHLILLEHPPVFTLGKSGDEANVLNPHDVPVVRTDRGGDVTYHGPGQLVGYPILHLPTKRLGIKSFVTRVEEAIVAGLADFGIEARRRDDCVGVWVGKEKIASLGFRVERGITRHGFALNVCNDLAPFGWIHPCGVPECPVTSISKVLGREVPVAEAAETVLPHLSRLTR